MPGYTSVLARSVFAVLLSRLVPSVLSLCPSLNRHPLLRNIIRGVCHDFSPRLGLFLALIAVFTHAASPQINRAPPRPGAPPSDIFAVEALRQEVDGPITKLRGAVVIETTDMILHADEVDYDERTDYFEA